MGTTQGGPHAERSHPDVVFLDLGVPGRDGGEVGRRLRARFGRDEVLWVATTGFGREEDRRRTGDAGFDRHLVKPIDLASLETLLSAASGDGR